MVHDRADGPVGPEDQAELALGRRQPVEHPLVVGPLVLQHEGHAAVGVGPEPRGAVPDRVAVDALLGQVTVEAIHR